ncbi:MAG: phosphate signaling complex protein PhoU [Desulfuromonadales bacterium]|nr:phosphate signaling complex protein PhoU [Desulfuromonadales bacterium]
MLQDHGGTVNNVQTRSKPDGDMEELRKQLLLMGGMVEQMIFNAVESLVERDSVLATQVVAMDHDVNVLEMAIDEKCLEILSMKKLVARDLRFISLSFKIVTDIERMGDKCANIAKRTLMLNDEAPLELLIDLPVMAQQVQQMVKQALDSFVQVDEELAYKVLREDFKVNEMNRQNQETLLDFMQSNSSAVKRAMKLNYACKSLERIADHATNIAEMVIFLIRGKDIRHTS